MLSVLSYSYTFAFPLAGLFYSSCIILSGAKSLNNVKASNDESLTGFDLSVRVLFNLLKMSLIYGKVAYPTTAPKVYKESTAYFLVLKSSLLRHCNKTGIVSPVKGAKSYSTDNTS